MALLSALLRERECGGIWAGAHPYRGQMWLQTLPLALSLVEPETSYLISLSLSLFIWKWGVIVLTSKDCGED